MTEQEFEALAAKMLARLAEVIEDAGGDAELAGGVLTVVTSAGKTFLLNKHAPLRQIWYSSPVSGAHHYAFKGGAWVSTRDGNDLLRTLATELAAAGIGIDLGAA